MSERGFAPEEFAMALRVLEAGAIVSVEMQSEALRIASTVMRPGWLEAVLEDADGHGADLVDPDCGKLASAIRDVLERAPQ